MGKISIKNLDLYYDDFKALKDVNLEIETNKITAFIGPSGCGKSTLLKSINRMNDQMCIRDSSMPPRSLVLKRPSSGIRCIGFIINLPFQIIFLIITLLFIIAYFML